MSATNGTSISHPLPRLRIHSRGVGGDSIRARGWEDWSKTESVDMTGLMNSQQLWLLAEDLHKTKLSTFQQGREGTHSPSSLPGELLAVDGF